METKRISISICAIIMAIYSLGIADWQRLPASDVDKEFISGIPGLAAGTPPVDNSCWLAASSNMLAGAGYGNGSTFQQRAQDIYNDMLLWQFLQDPIGDTHGTRDGGWMNNALNWWLGSANNIWPFNPYTVVTVYGGTGCDPWNNVNAPRLIGNWLRDYKSVSLGIRWPNCNGGHAVTPWGDDRSVSTLATNPDEIIMADSDRDNGGDFQTYTYDDFTNPNPGGANNGNGWYYNNSANHAYIIQAVTLSPTDSPVDPHDGPTQKCVGSYMINQNKLDDATDLHYTAYTDYNILGYHTEIDWTTANIPPAITESNTHYPHLTRSDIEVDWDLSDHPVPYGKNVTITTEFILQNWNGIRYDDVYFTYPGGEDTKYIQPPYNSTLGTDIRIDNEDGIGRLLADDFRCIETGSITKVYLWGSWLNDEGTGDAPGEVEKFHLYIYSDDPIGDDPNNPNDNPTNQYSMPLDLLWSGTFDQFETSEYSYVQEEYFWDAYLEEPLSWDNRIWQYEINIPERFAFKQQGSRSNPKVYWLGVAAQISGLEQSQFGWKTTNLDSGWNDAAVAWMGNFVQTDEFDFWEDQTSHSYAVSGSTDIGAYVCSGDQSLRVGSCDIGSSVKIIVNVTPNTDQVKLQYTIPWSGSTQTAQPIGATLYVDNSYKGHLVGYGCNWHEMVLNGMSADTADGELEIKIVDEVDGCNGDIQICYLKVYSTGNSWSPLTYPVQHELSGYKVDMSFAVVTSVSMIGTIVPGFGWNIVTPAVPNTNILDITGGYVIGAFDVFNMEGEPSLLGQYRFVHQYPYTQDPEHHVFTLQSPPDQINCEYVATNFRFGHLYGMPEANELWQFSDWMTASTAQAYLCSSTQPFTMTVNWSGLLPYPASNITPADQMPDPLDCSVYLEGDINEDCCVNMLDFAIMAGDWLECTTN